MLQTFLSRLSAVLALAAPLFATDTPGAGWGADSVRPLTLQTAFASHDTLANGNRVVFDGSLVWIEQDDGTVLATIGATPSPTFPSFVEADPSETFAVLGESSNGMIYRVPLSGGGGLVPLASLNSNYDLAFETGGATALVSAAHTGTGNQVFRLNLSTGATNLLVSVPGPSGPIALNGSGDLYYVTQVYTYPTPVDALSLVRWSAAQLSNGPWPLTSADASLVTPNLDGGASMVLDTASGSVYVAESSDGSPSRITEIDRFGSVVGTASTVTGYVGQIEQVDTAGAGALARFQPAGSRLLYRVTDFQQGTSVITAVSPRRPQLAAVQNGNGTMTVTLAGATPNTSCFVISSAAATYNPVESAFDLATYLFWTGMPFASIRRAGIQFPADANGAGTFTFANPGPIQGTRVIQVLVRDASGTFRGSSTTITN
ncbi:MAG: hypothetical protein NTY35_12885 [Planctomycetota bacterium]|nr:hypothetical protein [Planctomycetota bacterium]